jgi:predicted GIY-YIG superfamily endonuclease
MTVYILEFSAALGSARHRAKTYIGYCEPGRLHARLAEHRAGQGAKITAAAVERGYTLNLVAVIEGDRKLERRLKNFKNARRAIRWIQERPHLCPTCCHDLITDTAGYCWLCQAVAE